LVLGLVCVLKPRPSGALTIAAERTLFPSDQAAAELARAGLKQSSLNDLGQRGNAKTRSEWPRWLTHRWAYLCVYFWICCFFAKFFLLLIF